jgi:hypothetical protein
MRARGLLNAREKLTRMGSAVLLTGLLVPARPAHSQPIPVELAAGTRYATINLVMSKGFGETSRFGFFHLSTLVMDYDDEEQDDLSTQDLLFFEPVTGFRLTAGAFYGTRPGFNPTAGMQYMRAGRTLFLLVSPRINIESDPSFSVFSIARYRPDLTEHAKLYLGLRMLNSFDTERHIKSYQWLRAGVDIRGTQFGVTANVDERGPQPDVTFTVGLFVRREIR